MDYDLIVIGGGHNGLTTAALAAKRGRKVLVLEARDAVGGFAAGVEFHPGYRSTGVLHDTSGVRRSVVDGLFDGSPVDLVRQLVGGQSLSKNEIDALKSFVDELEE